MLLMIRVAKVMKQKWYFRQVHRSAALIFFLFFFLFVNSDETKEVLLLLVKIGALHIVEDFIEEHKLEHLKPMIGK